MANFSSRLKELKVRDRYTYQQLADLLALKLNTVQNYASGNIKPSFDVLLGFANLFNVSLDYMVGRSDDPKRY